VQSLLLISDRFWPEGGGGTLATYLITELLATCGDFRVTVITGTHNPNKINGVSFIVDKAFRIPNKPMRWFYFLRPSVKKRYRSLMKKFDIIYIPYGYPLIPLAKELDKRVIVHLHDYQPIAYNSTIIHNQRNGLVYDTKAELTYELFEHGSIKRAIGGSLLASAITMLCKAWVNKADTIICVSLRQAEIISNRAPELAHKIRVVYNPLPKTPPIRKKVEDSAFLYLGGDSYVKGFYVFLEGSQKFLKRNPKTSFILAGSYRYSSSRMISKFGKSYNLLGYVSHEEVSKLYSRSLALLFPSICEEPLPYAVIEGMLAKTIPIASRVGGVPEIVEGTYAEKMMFTPGDSNEMADKMEGLLSLSKDQLIDVGYKLRETALKRFDGEVIKRQLLKVFEA